MTRATPKVSPQSNIPYFWKIGRHENSRIPFSTNNGLHRVRRTCHLRIAAAGLVNDAWRQLSFFENSAFSSMTNLFLFTFATNSEEQGILKLKSRKGQSNKIKTSIKRTIRRNAIQHLPQLVTTVPCETSNFASSKRKTRCLRSSAKNENFYPSFSCAKCTIIINHE